jgi:hypothetical protein
MLVSFATRMDLTRQFRGHIIGDKGVTINNHPEVVR